MLMRISTTARTQFKREPNLPHMLRWCELRRSWCVYVPPVQLGMLAVTIDSSSDATCMAVSPPASSMVGCCSMSVTMSNAYWQDSVYEKERGAYTWNMRWPRSLRYVESEIGSCANRCNMRWRDCLRLGADTSINVFCCPPPAERTPS
jgi:hypothetical protein